MTFTVGIVTILCVIIAGLNWQLESRCRIFFTPFLILLGNEILRIMPSFVYAQVQGISTNLPSFFIFFLAFVAITSGFGWSMSVQHYKRSELYQFAKAEVVLRHQDRLLTPPLALMILLILAGLFFYRGIPPLGEMLFGLVTGTSPEEAAVAMGYSRELITKTHYFGGGYRGQGLFRFAFRIGWPLAIVYYYVLYYRSKEIKWLIFSIVSCIFGFLFVGGDGTRGPLLEMMLIVFVGISYIRAIRFRSILIVFAVSILLAIALSLTSQKLYFEYAEGAGFMDLIGAILHRIFIGNALNSVYAIDLKLDGAFNFGFGELHWRQILNSLPRGQGTPPFAYDLYLAMNPGGHLTTYLTPTYLAMAYVDFTLFVTLGIYFLLGVGIGFIQRRLFKIEKTPINTAFMAISAYYLGNITLTNPIALLPTGVVIAVFYILLKATAELESKYL